MAINGLLFFCPVPKSVNIWLVMAATRCDELTVESSKPSVVRNVHQIGYVLIIIYWFVRTFLVNLHITCCQFYILHIMYLMYNDIAVKSFRMLPLYQ